MKCLKCNFENTEGSRFCQNCGSNLSEQISSAPAAEVPPEYTVPQYQVPQQQAPVNALRINPAGDRLIAAFKDPLYLLLCIFLSVWASGLGVLPVLIAIFSWLCFVGAKKGNVNFNHLKVISAMTYTDYIITVVVGWIFFAIGITLSVCFTIATAVGNLSLAVENIPYWLRHYFFDIPSAIIGVVGILLGVTVTAMGIAFVIVGRRGLKRIHGFAKSVYKSVESGVENYVNVGAILGWIIAYGVVAGLSAVFLLAQKEFWSAFAISGAGASSVVAYMLVKKYFPSENK